MVHNKGLTKLGAIFAIIIIYAIVQFIHTVCYVTAQKETMPMIIENSVSVFCFAFFVAPIIVFIFHLGLRNSKVFFLEFWKKHWIFYLIYIIILFLIKKSVKLGYYFIEFSMFNLCFKLSENTFSAFIMAYLYILFYSVTSTLFFILLPNYFLILLRKNVHEYER